MTSAAPELLSALAALRETLVAAAVPHVFIGALPVLAWGRPRATTDVDVVVFCSATDFARLELELARRAFKPGKHIGPAESGDPLPDIAMYWLGVVRVDVFIAKMDFERAVLETAQSATVLDAELKIASCEASIIYKLLASRSKDLADVDSMFEARTAAGVRLDWTFLERWASEWGIGDRLAPYRARFDPRP